MESINDSIIQEDLENVVNCGIDFESMNGKTVFVTGATGLIGSQLVKAVLCADRLKNLSIRVLAYVRSKEKAEKVFGELIDGKKLDLVYGNLSEKINVGEAVDYIIHGASATSSKFFVEHPVETITTAIDGTRLILEFAKEKNVAGMVYLSSLEVYGTPAADAGTIDEEYSGYINPLKVRSSYSEGKRMVECLCVSYAEEYGVNVKIARLSQTFGAGVEYDDGRVFAEFARCAMEKKDIILHTQGNTVRSYCYTADAVSALLTILLNGEKANAYNVTNMNTRISIKDMGQLVCDTFKESDIKVTIDIPEDVGSFGYNPEMVIALDSSRLEKLGWKATVDLDKMFIRMIKSIQERN